MVQLPLSTPQKTLRLLRILLARLLFLKEFISRANRNNRCEFNALLICVGKQDSAAWLGKYCSRREQWGFVLHLYLSMKDFAVFSSIGELFQSWNGWFGSWVLVGHW